MLAKFVTKNNKDIKNDLLRAVMIKCCDKFWRTQLIQINHTFFGIVHSIVKFRAQ